MTSETQAEDVPRTDETVDPEAPSIDRLDEEGEIAADYLEELLDIADLDGDIEIDVENGRAAVEIVAESGGRSLRRLVGADGEVLDALQELTRLAVQTKTGERSRLMLDIAGHRAERALAGTDGARPRARGSGRQVPTGALGHGSVGLQQRHA